MSASTCEAWSTMREPMRIEEVWHLLAEDVHIRCSLLLCAKGVCPVGVGLQLSNLWCVWRV